MLLNQLSTTYHHAKRYKQIIDILIKYGFGYIVEKVGIILPRGTTRENPNPDDKMTTAQKVVMMLQELGPTFIKLGQVLSTRPDIIPDVYIKELKRLQDDVTPFSFETVKCQIEEELGCGISDTFKSLDETPLASASIGQVHRAVLINGQEVVVKVRRPDIDKIITVDLEIILNLTRLIERHIPEARIYDPVGKVEEFAEAMHKELDFTREGFNVDRFRQNFEGDNTIYVPKVFWEATTQKVLTIEYIHGFKISQLNKIAEQGLDTSKIAENGARAILKQIFVYGFFHGDPHPGNILIMPDGKIAFIDFGMMGRIDKYTKYKLADLIIGVINKDTGKIVSVLLELSQSDEDLSTSDIELDVEDLIERYYAKTLKDVNMSKLLNEVLTIVAKYKIMLPSNFTLLLKSLITIEGVGIELNPDFNIFEVAKPFVKKMLMDRYAPAYIFKEALINFREFNKSLTLIPKLISGLYQRSKTDSIKLDFETKGAEKVLIELNKMINRLVFSMIVAALIIGSSLIIQADVGPFLFNYPFLGILGFVTAGLLGIWLIVSILRTGKI
ncbi:MAG: 2-polyprenylphenol 6-hydroxylase [Thermoanaerobacteraceae bacterium]|nr:2-polyprenylphenol 6-hydroxylase [Thermoanaerobacteraceae bacterium]